MTTSLTNEQITASIDLAQLDKLEALARAATQGPWTVRLDGTCSGTWPHIDAGEDEFGDPITVAELSTTHTETEAARTAGGIPGAYEEAPSRFELTDQQPLSDAAFIAAANPATLLPLIALARRSLTSGAPADLKYLTRYDVGGDGELQEMVCGDAYLVKDVEELFAADVHDAAAPSAEDAVIDTGFLIELVNTVVGHAGTAFNHAYCPSSDPFKNAKASMLNTADALRAAIRAIDLSAGAAAKTEQAPMQLCPRCQGSGEGKMMVGGGPDAYEIDSNCAECGGIGEVPATAAGAGSRLQRDIEALLNDHGYARVKAALTEFFGAAGAASAQPRAEGGERWTCFHCGESFTDRDAARLHFGATERQQPICFVDQQRYREMEARMEAYNAEDADIHRQMHAQENRHQQALRRAEEDGYAKGLKDATLDQGAQGATTANASDGQASFPGCLADRLYEAISIARDRAVHAGSTSRRKKWEATAADLRAALARAPLPAQGGQEEASTQTVTSGAAGTVEKDAARLDWLNQNFFSDQKDEWDERQSPNSIKWKFFGPMSIQGDVRRVIDAAIEAHNKAGKEQG